MLVPRFRAREPALHNVYHNVSCTVCTPLPQALNALLPAMQDWTLLEVRLATSFAMIHFAKVFTKVNACIEKISRQIRRRAAYNSRCEPLVLSVDPCLVHRIVIVPWKPHNAFWSGAPRILWIINLTKRERYRRTACVPINFTNFPGARSAWIFRYILNVKSRPEFRS